MKFVELVRAPRLHTCRLLLSLAVAWTLVPGQAGAQQGLEGLLSDEPEPRPSPEPAPSAVPENATQARAIDRRIEQRLRGIFRQVEELEKVTVDVRDGVVHLRGQTVERKPAERAVALARSLQGVVYVDDDIAQVFAVRTQAAPMVVRVQDKLGSLLAKLPVLALAVALVLPFWLIAIIVRRWDAPFRWLSDSLILRDILRRLLATVVITLGVISALELMEATAIVGAVLGTAGLLGVAVGFAFRDMIENYLASVMLGVRRPFSARDHVVIDGHEGLVIRLTTRETILMTLEGNHLRLPNAVVFKSVILNYTRNPRRRFDFVVGAGVEEDLSAAQKLGVKALAATPGVLASPPPLSLIEALGDSSVALRFAAWIDQRDVDYLKARSEAIRRVKTVLEDAGVDMPVPIYRVELQQGPSSTSPVTETHAARRRARLPEVAPKEAELAPEDHIEAQIREEESVSNEQNLL